MLKKKGKEKNRTVIKVMKQKVMHTNTDGIIIMNYTMDNWLYKI